MGFTLTHDKAAEVFGEICAIGAGDDLAFELLRTEDIREADEYPGIRVFLRARYAPLAVPITVDVTTGDRITPIAIAYDYPFVFDEGSARIMAYPLEIVLAEKVETVLARNVATTRTATSTMSSSCGASREARSTPKPSVRRSGRRVRSATAPPPSAGETVLLRRCAATMGLPASGWCTPPNTPMHRASHSARRSTLSRRWRG